MEQSWSFGQSDAIESCNGRSINFAPDATAGRGNATSGRPLPSQQRRRPDSRLIGTFSCWIFVVRFLTLHLPQFLFRLRNLLPSRSRSSSACDPPPVFDVAKPTTSVAQDPGDVGSL